MSSPQSRPPISDGAPHTHLDRTTMVIVLSGLLLGVAGLLLEGAWAVVGAVLAVTAAAAGYYRELHRLAATVDPPAHEHDRRYSATAR